MSKEIKVTNVKKSRKNVFTELEKKYRQEASRKVSMANKRLKRMEEQNLTMSPAYKKWIDEGGQKFGIKGKSMEEVRIEVARLNKFLKQTTSTVKGTKKYLTNIASQVGIKQWGSFQSLNNQLRGFFEVADRVQEYLKNSKEVSVSIDYKKIWELVNEYAETTGKEFASLNDNIVDIANAILQANSYSKLDDLTDDFLRSFIDK